MEGFSLKYKMEELLGYPRDVLKKITSGPIQAVGCRSENCYKFLELHLQPRSWVSDAKYSMTV